ncbi:MAG: right-handed parallel beta-helix repeat-containing protein [Myxococcaceae bacterium]
MDIAASADPSVRASQRELLKTSLQTDDTVVRLGPGVDLDFSDLPGSWFPITFGRCVTLTSVDSFGDSQPTRAGGGVSTPPGPGRTPQTLGPVLRYGKPKPDGSDIFLDIACEPFGDHDGDGARISGIRLFGPDFGFQQTSETGIRVFRCVDVEISNMEIAGWGAAAIDVSNLFPGADGAPASGARITHPDQVRIHDCYIHHNQHPDPDILPGTALGYGVVSDDGAWVRISRNVFDFNRHAIAASGNTGGYWADQNLVLRGGGYEGHFYNNYTHSFDAHGTGCWWSKDQCGDAGIEFWILSNTWQYRKETDIHIRGKPLIGALIDDNVFPFADRGDAIALYTDENVTVGRGNTFGVDTFGQYGVCDFDGDGVDDLFLATGRTWWFSSYGELQWSFLAARTERLDQVKLAYVTGDKRCDVVAEHNGRWVVSSGGTGPWESLGAFGVPLSQVQLGRFDPAARDQRPNVTRQTTHAFFAAPDGQWWVTPLIGGPAWHRVASSSFPMSELRFGDFNGDGVTDVLAVVDGRWAISDAAIGSWQQLNRDLGTAVKDLYIANMDPDDNIDDLLWLERQVITDGQGTFQRVDLTWWRSRNGIEPWQRWKTYSFAYPLDAENEPVTHVFVGRFGAAPGGGALVIDQNRMGRFYSPAEVPAGGFADWSAAFPY